MRESLPKPQGWFTTPSLTGEEYRDLREKAVTQAVYLHGESNIVFERDESVQEVLKTAQSFYDWIIGQ
jgi:hypothetical protein